MTNFVEDDLRLFVLIAPLDRHSVGSAGDHTGDKQQVADAQRVGPPAWRRLPNVGAGNSFDLHRRVLKIKREVLPFPVVLYFYIRESPTDRFKSQSALLTKNVVKLPYEFAVSSAPFLCRKEMNPPDVFPTEIPVYVLA